MANQYAARLVPQGLTALRTFFLALLTGVEKIAILIPTWIPVSVIFSPDRLAFYSRCVMPSISSYHNKLVVQMGLQRAVIAVIKFTPSKKMVLKAGKCELVKNSRRCGNPQSLSTVPSSPSTISSRISSEPRWTGYLPLAHKARTTHRKRLPDAVYSLRSPRRSGGGRRIS